MEEFLGEDQSRRADKVFAQNDADTEDMFECVVCKDPVHADEAQVLTCEHYHCNACIKANAQTALNTRPFVPAKCCSIIGRSVLLGTDALTDEEMKRYEAKVEEAFTQKYKFYCYDTNCNEYIPVNSLNQRSGTCLYCGRKTCKICLSKTHWGPCNKEVMARDTGVADELMNKMAVSKKWKRCPKCQKMVEKNGGCNHVVCTCGQAFCYACGKGVSRYDETGHMCSEAPSGGVRNAQVPQIPNEQKAFLQG